MTAEVDDEAAFQDFQRNVTRAMRIAAAALLAAPDPEEGSLDILMAVAIVNVLSRPRDPNELHSEMLKRIRESDQQFLDQMHDMFAQNIPIYEVWFSNVLKKMAEIKALAEMQTQGVRPS